MSVLILGAALELARWLGPSHAVAFLADQGIAPEVVNELLAKEMQLYPPPAERRLPGALDRA